MSCNTKIFQWLHAGAGTRPFVDGLAIFLAEGGPYLLAALFVALWFLMGQNKKAALLEATEAAGIGLVLNQLTGLFYFHPRPFMVGLCTPLFPHVPENSFPSDHTTLMLSAALYLLLFRGWFSCGLALLLASIATAWGRVYIGVHFPFDMLGSLVIALASAGLMSRLAGVIAPMNDTISVTVQRCTRGLASIVKGT